MVAPVNKSSVTKDSLLHKMASILDGMGHQAFQSTPYDSWINAKALEKYATDARRAIEDELISTLRIQDIEGVKTVKAPGYKVKVTQRFNRSIDADLLQEVAAEHGIIGHLSDLFRWKPEINARAWATADESITGPLLAAITTKPGRPSFSIEKDEE